MLPDNETSYQYPPLIQKRIDRQLVYAALETKMNSFVYRKNIESRLILRLF